MKTVQTSARLTPETLRKIEVYFDRPTTREILEALISICEDDEKLRSLIYNTIYDARHKNSEK